MADAYDAGLGLGRYDQYELCAVRGRCGCPATDAGECGPAGIRWLACCSMKAGPSVLVGVIFWRGEAGLFICCCLIRFICVIVDGNVKYMSFLSRRAGRCIRLLITTSLISPLLQYCSNIGTHEEKNHIFPIEGALFYMLSFQVFTVL